MSQAKFSVAFLPRSERAQAILDDFKIKFGILPNIAFNLSANTALIESYYYANESFGKQSGFTAIERDAILLAVSYVNDCDYCMAAHSFGAENFSKAPADIIEAIRNGEALPDDKLNALVTFTKKMVEQRGKIAPDDLSAFFAAGYTENHALGVIAGIAIKTMTNYTRHITEIELDTPFQVKKWQKSIRA